MQWTGSNDVRIIYDSDTDGVGHDTLAARLHARKNVLVVAVADTGDLLGGFVGVTMNAADDFVYDSRQFLFFAPRGAWRAVQRWVPTNVHGAFVQLPQQPPAPLIVLGTHFHGELRVCGPRGESAFAGLGRGYQPLAARGVAFDERRFGCMRVVAVQCF